jgi:ubiquinone/menaquinone biosynthesis C-methylase UbiE
MGADDESRWVFNRMAEAYRFRPAYPAELVSRLVSLAGGPGSSVVDLGAGTGHLALPLARAGLRVTAVEPAAKMLDVFVERVLAASLEVEVSGVNAPAEETWQAAASFELAVIADALHWIDPERTGRELRRILVAGGRVAVVELETISTPFVDAVVALARARNPRAFPERREPPRERLRHLFAAAGAALAAEELLEQEVLVPVDEVPGLLASVSFIGPALGPQALLELGEEAQAIAVQLGGARWARMLRLTHARLR